MKSGITIGDNIRKTREFNGLSQLDLAKILNVSDRTISSWEVNRTEPKIDMLEKICNALKCQTTDIIDGEKPNTMHLTKHEKALITAYRGNKSLQEAIDRILKI